MRRVNSPPYCGKLAACVEVWAVGIIVVVVGLVVNEVVEEVIVTFVVVGLVPVPQDVAIRDSSMRHESVIHNIFIFIYPPKS